MKSAILPIIISLTAVFGTSNANAAEQDNILQKFGDPLRIYHMYSTPDGQTKMDLENLASVPGKPEFRYLLNDSASQARLLYTSDGHVGVWHHTDPATLIVSLQGDLVLDLGDGKDHHLTAGTVVFGEDNLGRGHKEHCIAKEGAHACVLLAVALAHPVALKAQMSAITGPKAPIQ